MNHHAFLTVRVGYEWYGIAIESVIEVLYMVALTELPDAADDVLGLMKLRQDILPVIDLRLRFGLSDAKIHLNTPIVAIRTPEGQFGLVVDDVDAVEIITDSTVYDGTESHYIDRVAQVSDKLLLLLNVGQLHTGGYQIAAG